MPLETSFLGRGWAFPPTFTRAGGEVVTVADEADVRESLEILLGTRPGERVMRESFGCELGRFLFEEVDQSLRNAVARTVRDAVIYHEPRIKLNRLEVTESGDEPGLLLIRLDYTVRATNSRFNMVYPFYLDEATLPA